MTDRPTDREGYEPWWRAAWYQFSDVERRLVFAELEELGQRGALVVTDPEGFWFAAPLKSE